MKVQASGVLAAPAKTATKQRGQKTQRKVQQRRQRIAQRGPDVEQRRHLATLEAAAQRSDGEGHLGGEIPWRQGVLESLDDHWNAQAGIAPGIQPPQGCRHQQATQQRTQRRVSNVTPEPG